MLSLWMLMSLFVHAQEFQSSAAEVIPIETLYEEPLPKEVPTKDFIVLSNGFRFEVVPESTHPLAQELSQLSDEQLKSFKERRRKILLTMSKFLSYRKIANGLGYIENGKISMIKDGSSTLHPLDNILESEGVQKLTGEEHVKYRFKVLNKVLHATDQFLFKNAIEASTHSEFGIDLAFFGNSVNGVRGQIRGHNLIFGRGYGLQILLGVDFETNQKNFQIKVLKERPNETKAAIINPIGVTVRVGVYLKQRNNLPQSYDVFYPPLLPLYAVKSNGIVSAGYSSAFTPITLLAPMTLGLTAFLENAMTYKGTDSVYTVLDSNTVRLYLGRIRDFIRKIKEILIPIHKSSNTQGHVIHLDSIRALRAKARSCSLLFN